VKNKALFGLIGVVVMVCGALVAFAAWKILKRPRAGGGVAGRISRDAAVVVIADFRNVRAWEPATRLHDLFARPGADATGPQREVAQRYAEVLQNCGFDPWTKTDAVTVGVDRSVIEGRDQSAVTGLLDGTFTQAEAERCIRYLASRDQRTLASTQVARHTVLTPLRTGEQPSARSTQLTLFPGSLLVTESSYTQRALAVIDGESPALANDSPLTTMIGRLGAGVFLGASADLAELRARQQRTVDGAIDDLVRAHPQAPDLALLRQARIGGASLAVLNGSLTAMARVEEPSGANATSVARALEAVIEQHRGEALGALRDARQSQQFLRLALGSTPGMTERFRKLDDAATVLEALIGQVHCRAEGSDAVVALTATQAQVTSVQQGVTAFSEIMAEASRMNPLGGLFGGGNRGGSAPEPGMPELDRAVPALQAPTLGAPSLQAPTP
jgi:hypothetical protein